MKKLLVINPNSSKKMTQDIAASLEHLCTENRQIDVIHTPGAPNVLESFADYTLAGSKVIELLTTSQIDKSYDGIVLACYGDPCLKALKEIFKVPIIGIAEASMAMALTLGYRFSIIGASDKAKYMMQDLVLEYGLTERMASVEALGINIEAFLEDKEMLEAAFIKAGKAAIANGAEAVIYGCAGMTMLDNKAISRHLGVPVLDPVLSGLSMLEGILVQDLEISKIGLYS